MWDLFHVFLTCTVKAKQSRGDTRVTKKAELLHSTHLPWTSDSLGRAQPSVIIHGIDGGSECPRWPQKEMTAGEFGHPGLIE